jgi:hypothetical protein
MPVGYFGLTAAANSRHHEPDHEIARLVVGQSVLGQRPPRLERHRVADRRHPLRRLVVRPPGAECGEQDRDVRLIHPGIGQRSLSFTLT